MRSTKADFKITNGLLNNYDGDDAKVIISDDIMSISGYKTPPDVQVI